MTLRVLPWWNNLMKGTENIIAKIQLCYKFQGTETKRTQENI